MIQWYKKVIFENYANFSGRARRSEYWYFVLMQLLIIFPISIIMILSIVRLENGGSFVGVVITIAILGLYSLATIVPRLAVTCRRLHDIDKSGWYYFIGLIPAIGGIWLLVLLSTEGDHGSNQYGDDPKEISDGISEIGTKDTY